MRKPNLISVGLLGLILFAGTNCHSSDARHGVQTNRWDTTPVRRAAFTMANNPTTNAGRGNPDLEDAFKPGTWVFIDGRSGVFSTQEGSPQVQWFISKPVADSPTFRVEALQSLLGDPDNFACTLDTVSSEDGSSIAYAIKAEPGTFQAGREYSLLNPGSNFTIRNRISGDVVSEIAPLPKGQYLLAAKVENIMTGARGLAITHFVVGN